MLLLVMGIASSEQSAKSSLALKNFTQDYDRFQLHLLHIIHHYSKPQILPTTLRNTATRCYVMAYMLHKQNYKPQQQLPLYVFTKPSPTKDWQWTCFVPQKVTVTSYEYDTSLKNLLLPAPPQYHIELCHSNLNHYDRVVPLDFSGDSKAFLPPPEIPASFWEAVLD